MALKTFIIDLVIFAIIMAIFLVGLPRQKEAPLLRDYDVVVARPEGGVRYHERIIQSESGSVIKVFSYVDTTQNSYGTIRWQLRLMCTFDEQNGEYVFTNAQHESLIYNTLYYEKDADIVLDGDTVTCHITVGKHLYGIPFGAEEFVVTLKCNPDGTVS